MSSQDPTAATDRPVVIVSNRGPLSYRIDGELISPRQIEEALE